MGAQPPLTVRQGLCVALLSLRRTQITKMGSPMTIREMGKNRMFSTGAPRIRAAIRPMIGSALRSVLLGGVMLAAGTASAAPAYSPPMTSFGQPDIQGTWSNATLTPFTREAQYGARLTLTPEEAAKIEKTNDALNKDGLKPTDPKATIKDLPVDCGRGFKGVDCGYNSFWTDPGNMLIRIDGQPRTSIVVEPANGQLPPMTPEGQKRAMALMARFRGGGQHAYDNPESRSLGERCITSFGSSAGPPMLPLLYNNNYQIVQTPDAIAIEVEMVHDVRIVKLNGQHGPANIRSWMGDSIGHWEGKTLVIETTNIRQEQAMYGMGSEDFRVTERLTRISPDKILYQFTVDDPKTYKAPFKGELTFNATKGPVYEYACHEGNYALPHILAGARSKEKQGLPYDEPVKGDDGKRQAPKIFSGGEGER